MVLSLFLISYLADTESIFESLKIRLEVFLLGSHWSNFSRKPICFSGTFCRTTKNFFFWNFTRCSSYQITFVSFIIFTAYFTECAACCLKKDSVSNNKRFSKSIKLICFNFFTTSVESFDFELLLFTRKIFFFIYKLC